MPPVGSIGVCSVSFPGLLTFLGGLAISTQHSCHILLGFHGQHVTLVRMTKEPGRISTHPPLLLFPLSSLPHPLLFLLINLKQVEIEL